MISLNEKSDAILARSSDLKGIRFLEGREACARRREFLLFYITYPDLKPTLADDATRIIGFLIRPVARETFNKSAACGIEIQVSRSP